MPKNEAAEKSRGEIPKELVELVESEGTASKIAEVCLANGVEDETSVQEIAYKTGRVLLGDLPPEEFPAVLKEQVDISAFLADKISRGINEEVFYLVKENLIDLYREEALLREESSSKNPPSKESKSPEEKDIYRESVE